jgi:hypothetical protein
VTFNDWTEFSEYREAHDLWWDYADDEGSAVDEVLHLSGVRELHTVGAGRRVIATVPRLDRRVVAHVLRSNTTLEPAEIAVELRGNTVRWQRWCVEYALRGSR